MNKEIIHNIIENKFEKFPWYRELANNWLNFEKLPLITRDMLDQHYYNQPPPGDDLIEFTTSGTSTGAKRKIFYSKDEIRYNNNQKTELFKDFIGDLKTAGIVVGIGLAASSAKDVFESFGMEAFVVSYKDNIKLVNEFFPKYKPEVIYSMPSLIDTICRRVDKAHFSSVKKVILVGEILTEQSRKKISSVIGIQPEDILNTYGCVELGLLAYECNSCGKFHIVNNVYPEISVKNSSGQFVSSYEKDGILTITSLWRKNIPAIRYVTYDIIEGFGKSTCNGIEYNSFQKIIGRIGNEFKHGERLSFYDIESALLKVVPDANFRVVIKDNKIKLLLLSSNSGYSAEILERIRQSVNYSNKHIGEMIENGMLEKIEVEIVEEESSFQDTYKKRIAYIYE